MELTIKILKVDTLGRKNDQTVQAHLVTNLHGNLNADLPSLFKMISIDEFYRIPNCIEAIARFYRNKIFTALHDYEKELIENIPEDLKERYETAIKACFIMDATSIEFKSNYEKIMRIFKKKSFCGVFNEQAQIMLYKNLRKKLNTLQILNVGVERKIAIIEEFLSYFDPGIVLLVEIGEA